MSAFVNASAIGLWLFGLLLSELALGQFSAASLAFDVADVHVSATRANFVNGGFLPGGHYRLRGATMLDLVRTAWGLDADYVYGGPSWLDLDRFDVIAQASPGSTKAERAMMLRSLLADRFKLVVHNDEKSMTVFALTVGKRGPLLKESAGWERCRL